MNKTPFDELYYSSNGDSEEHLELTQEKYDQLLDEIVKYHRPKNSDDDSDGLSNAAELDLGSKMLDPDSDNDGMLDGFEYKYSLALLSSENSISQICSNSYYEGLGPQNDADCDGLTNLAEHNWNSNPRSLDSDNDNILDYDEVLIGRHPAVNEPALVAIVNGLLL